MLYSLVVLQPRARAYFQATQQFEQFLTFVAAGARWKVLGGFGLIAATGVILLPFAGRRAAGWTVCIISKSILFLLAVGIFGFASWVLWPSRVLAAEHEIADYQRKFRYIAITLIFLVTLSIILGVIGSHPVG